MPEELRLIPGSARTLSPTRCSANGRSPFWKQFTGTYKNQPVSPSSRAPGGAHLDGCRPLPRW
jgi:hypothetical protein